MTEFSVCLTGADKDAVSLEFDAEPRPILSRTGTGGSEGDTRDFPIRVSVKNSPSKLKILVLNFPWCLTNIYLF